jgi:hypothetical protein
MSFSRSFFFCWRACEAFWSCQTSGEASRTFIAAHSAFLRSRSKKTSDLFDFREEAGEACLEVLGRSVDRRHVLFIPSWFLPGQYWTTQ